jgi:hypothetical protein
MFPLRHPGRVAAHHHPRALTALEAGDLFALFEEAVCRSTQRVPNGTSSPVDTTRIRRTHGLVRQGAFRKATQALSSAPQTPSGPATVAGLQALHPPAVHETVLNRSVLPPPTLISASVVEPALYSFLRGSAPGASGLRHSHMAEMLHAPSPQAAALASDAVTNLSNRLASRRALTSFAPWLCGAPLTALAKPNSRVRPIAVGEVIRRLVAKCLMARVRQPAQALLAPLRLGVAVKGGGGGNFAYGSPAHHSPSRFCRPSALGSVADGFFQSLYETWTRVPYIASTTLSS